ncbi:TetR/AcrR family transcriptional regulator [Nocardia asteroides]|uniref:TetR family transcriptional regulator n=1 Tax=Nocardia asteroides NBRC 15531 TaxID=1110697 RepID=U5EC91_NOCAS|nr:TetR family transcriptional regulator [Nocardia asteroides]UGT48056.1 TetR family transcriptional regulator [Nocardia asteroides]GAD82779.1 putative TetR family transcriptional regulator [Nocardia asteroides NBRC 15531]SFM63560.1 transcriptional regulator, TetR family [Nocardia asteroides]VEG33001.1 putative DNA-binding transcriptional regulator [Nocardia asteroides]
MTSADQHTPARRSDATKAVILDAARARFAVDGYAKATIRAIAADAEIDPSMVMRYFGSKDGLFAAAVQIDLDLPDLAAAPPEAMGELLVRRFLAIWEGRENTVLLILLRSSITDDKVADRFRAIFAEQVLPAVLRFGDPADAPRRGGLVVTQLLGIALCRYILRLPPVVEMRPDQLIADVSPVIQGYLTSVPDR